MAHSMVPPTSWTIYNNDRQRQVRLERYQGTTYDFQRFREALFLRGSLVVLHVALRLVGQAIIGVCAADGAVSLVQDRLRLLQ